MIIPAPYLDRIRRSFPNLVISKAHLNHDGLVNDVVIVNDEFVFRFPKTRWARESLAQETKILDLAREHVDLPVPFFKQRQEDSVVYRLIPGVALHRDHILGQDETIQDRLAGQIATFLHQLHTIPRNALEKHSIPQSDAVRSHGDWVRLYEDAQRELFPLMMADAKDWVRRHFEPVVADRSWMDYEPALTHGDLGPYHILYDKRAQKIRGVIDFGTAGMGDPATDFACLINAYGEAFLARMSKYYPEIADTMERARFWAGTLELQWALMGVRTKDLSWFLVHIGRARDAIPMRTRRASGR